MTYRVICQGWSFGGGEDVGFIGLCFGRWYRKSIRGCQYFPHAREEFLIPPGISQYRNVFRPSEIHRKSQKAGS